MNKVELLARLYDRLRSSVMSVRRGMPRRAFSTKWLNENMIEGEMSNDDFQQAVIKHMQQRVKREREEERLIGNDGMLRVYQERRIHRGIPYELKVLRYFAVRRLPDSEFEITGYSINAIGKYVIVEGLPRFSFRYDLEKLLGLDEFLWHDTLHGWQLDWSLRKQWDHAEKWAIEDCERLGPAIKFFIRKFAAENWTRVRRLLSDFVNLCGANLGRLFPRKKLTKMLTKTRPQAWRRPRSPKI